MRQIEFRGKDLDTKEWRYGDLEIHRNDSRRLIHSYNDDGGYNRQYDVDEETIGQFTGLYDANHKMIFEGDLVAATGSVVEEIVYDCTLSRFVTAIGGDKDKLGCNPTQSWIDQIHIIVVGNKWDDPELLK